MNDKPKQMERAATPLPSPWELLSKNGRTTLPRSGLREFIQKGESELLRDTWLNHYDQHEMDGFEEFYKMLYSVEYAATQVFRPKSMTAAGKFLVGHGRIDQRRRDGETIELNSQLLKSHGDYLDESLPEANFDAGVDAICEIGSAMGYTAKHLTDRFNPNRYYVYEIDDACARWTEQTLGVTAMIADGETLVGLGDQSIDLCVSINVFQHLPEIKTFSYLHEFERTLKKGGHAFFDVRLSDDLTSERIKEILDQNFPQRCIPFVSRSVIESVFDDRTHKIISETVDNSEEPEVRTFLVQKTA